MQSDRFFRPNGLIDSNYAPHLKCSSPTICYSFHSTHVNTFIFYRFAMPYLCLFLFTVYQSDPAYTYLYVFLYTKQEYPVVCLENFHNAMLFAWIWYHWPISTIWRDCIPLMTHWPDFCGGAFSLPRQSETCFLQLRAFHSELLALQWTFLCSRLCFHINVNNLVCDIFQFAGYCYWRPFLE